MLTGHEHDMQMQREVDKLLDGLAKLGHLRVRTSRALIPPPETHVEEMPPRLLRNPRVGAMDPPFFCMRQRSAFSLRVLLRGPPLQRLEGLKAGCPTQEMGAADPLFS